MSDIIRASLDGIREFADVDTVFGKAITTANGVTVIPVSRVSVGFATGGLDFNSKKAYNSQNFGGGGGTGISISPVAFLTVGKDAEISLLEIGKNQSSTLERVLGIVENSPELIEKIKNSISG